MVKRALVVTTVLLVLSQIFLLGCSAFSKPTGSLSPGSIEVIRETQLGADWYVKQMRVEVEVGEGESRVLLKLADGDKVDGFFYLEKGSEVEFKILGDSLIYESKGKESKKVVSDRFSITASKAQGSTYVLSFHNADKKQSKLTVFLEVIYPVTASVFVPIETK